MTGSVDLGRGHENVPAANIQIIGIRKTNPFSGETKANVWVIGESAPLTNITVSFPQKKYDLMRELTNEGWDYANLSLVPLWELAAVRKELRLNWLANAEITLSRKSTITVNSRAVDTLKKYNCFKKYQGTITCLFEGNFVVVQEKPFDIQAEVDSEMMLHHPCAPRVIMPKPDFFAC